MSGHPIHLDPYAKFYVNDYWMAKFFTVEGAAVGYLPDFSSASKSGKIASFRYFLSGVTLTD